MTPEEFAVRRHKLTHGTQISINCRWAAKSITGTERYALEITRELVSSYPEQVILQLPSDAREFDWMSVCRIVRSRSRGMLFEQLALPFKTRGQTLLSMGGASSILKRNQASVLFDASVHRYPETFSSFFRLWYLAMYWITVRTVRYLFTISGFSASEIADVTRTSKSSFTVAFCGSEHSVAYAAKRPAISLPPQFVVLIGTLAPRKNLVPVVDALTAAGIATVVVGAAGKAHVFASGGGFTVANPLLMVAGRISDDEIAWLLDHAVALVFPSLYEGFGLPIVEAQSRGCAVVASNASCVPEIAGYSTLLFDPARPEDAVAAVKELIDSPSIRQEVVDRGRRNAQRFSWRSSAQTIARVLGLGGPKTEIVA